MLTTQAPSASSTLLHRWIDTSWSAHLAECRVFLNSIEYCRSLAPLDAGLATSAADLRCEANEARKEALHPANFARPVLWPEQED